MFAARNLLFGISMQYGPKEELRVAALCAEALPLGAAKRDQTRLKPLVRYLE